MPNVELICSSIGLPEHNIILWLAGQERLLTNDKLVGIGLHCDNVDCVLCDDCRLEDEFIYSMNTLWQLVYGATYIDVGSQNATEWSN